MLREFQTNVLKTTDAMYKADATMITGAPVVKNYADKTVSIAANGTIDGFFFVNKERVPTGLNCAKGDMSDYDENFTKIAENENVKLIIPETGERYGTDQYTLGALTVGDAVMVTGGKFVKANVASRLIFGGEYNDVGHKLAIIEIAGSTKTNA